MKPLLLLICFFISAHSFAQLDYWQQQVNYTIDVQLNDQQNTLSGIEVIEYINNSPDTLHFIWFHLWPNAYKNNSTAWSKEGNTERVTKRTIGFIDSLQFTVDGQVVITEQDPKAIDQLKIILPSALAPGKTIIIRTSFFVKIPPYTSRMGYVNNNFSITQWYPKPAVYDRKGWHPMSYLDMGEFYSEFGNYTVNITVPDDYIIAATGALQNEDELTRYKKAGTATNESLPPISPVDKKGALKTLQYKAVNVHDFAWFADRDFTIKYAPLKLKNGQTIDLFSFYKSQNENGWKESINQMSKVAVYLSNEVGNYPYPVISAVEGVGNRMSGGMEYPMVCLINSNNYLAGIIAHEVAHNWFYGILGTNERDHAWMDEGMTTFFESNFFTQNSTSTISRSINIFGSAQIDQPSELYQNMSVYTISVYIKAARWLEFLKAEIGAASFKKGIQLYYQRWQFKHPYPEDFKQIMEEASGQNLDKIFRLLFKKGNI